MSEDPNQSPDEPEVSEPEPTILANKPQEQPEPTILANKPQYPPTPEVYIQPEAVTSSGQPQYPPTPEVYIQPEAVTSSGQPQYPPAPGFYAQQPQQPQSPPPIQNPYATPSTGYGAQQTGYGAPNFPPPPVYAYAPVPQAQPLPLGQAIRELPSQYWKILRKPGPRTFAAEQGKAEWGIIWIQILFFVLFEAILALPIALMEGSLVNSDLAASGSATNLNIPTSVFIVAVTIGVIVFAPLVFFAEVGIQWLLARAFKGTGWFKQQAYNQLLFQVPVTFITALLYLIITPFLGGLMSSLAITSTQTPAVNPVSLLVVLLVGLVASGVGIYGIVLNVFSIMAAQRLSGGRATGVVLIPYAVLFVLYFGCVCAATLTTLH